MGCPFHTFCTINDPADARFHTAALFHLLRLRTCKSEWNRARTSALVLLKGDTMQPQNNTDLTPNEARQGERVGLVWVLTAGTLIAIMGIGAVMLGQAV
jgi:hypothetical protein